MSSTRLRIGQWHFSLLGLATKRPLAVLDYCVGWFKTMNLYVEIWFSKPTRWVEAVVGGGFFQRRWGRRNLGSHLDICEFSLVPGDELAIHWLGRHQKLGCFTVSLVSSGEWEQQAPCPGVRWIPCAPGLWWHGIPKGSKRIHCSES